MLGAALCPRLLILGVACGRDLEVDRPFVRDDRTESRDFRPAIRDRGSIPERALPRPGLEPGTPR